MPRRAFCLFFVFVSADDDFRLFGLNVACLGQSDLGQQRTEEFIDQYAEEHDVTNSISAAEFRFGNDRHTECDTCLRQQRYAQPFPNAGGTVCGSGTPFCTEIFTGRTADDVDDTEDNTDEQ